MPTTFPRGTSAQRIREARRRAKEQDDKRKEMQGRAWRATRAFNKMTPQLTSYVRAISGDRTLVVRPTAGITRTDGRVVWIRPPLKLGDDIPHEKMRCSTRNKTTHRQECPACDQHEMVMACVYHELAHILFGTMVPPIDEGLRPIHDLIREWHPIGVCDHAPKIFEQIIQWAQTNDDTYLANAAAFDPRLKLLLNSLEDARVNSAMFTARPGTRAMMDANVAEVFEDGIEGTEEQNERWQDRDLDSQIFVGLFLMASEYYNHIDELSKEAREILYHDEVEPLIMTVGRCYTIHEVAELTVRIWRKLQQFGRFEKPKCVPEPEPEDMPGLPSDCAGDAGQDGEAGDEGEAGDAADAAESSTETGDGAGSPGSSDGSSESGSSQDSDPADGDGGTDANADDAETEDGEDQVDAGLRGTPDRSPDSGDARDEQPDDTGGGSDQQDSDGSAGSSGGSAGGDSHSGGHSDHDGGEEPDAGEDEDNAGGSERSADQEANDEAADTDEPDAGPDAADHGDQSTTEDGTSSEEDGDDADDTAITDEHPGEGAGAGDSGEEPGDGELDGEADGRDGDGSAELEATARGISLHDLIQQTNPGSDTKEFACGHTDKDRTVDLSGGDDDEDEDEEGYVGDFDLQLPGVGDAGHDDQEMLRQLAIAIIQAMTFDAPSVYIHGMAEVEFPNSRTGWVQNHMYPEDSDPKTFMPGEGVIGRLSLAAKLVFEENDRAKYETNLKRGRINGRRLAQRVPDNDPRMFRKKLLPGKRSHHVVIGMDCSGSTGSVTSDGQDAKIARSKRAVFAQAEMLSRLGIGFEVWAHSAGYGDPVNRDGNDDAWGWMLAIKRANQPWDHAAKLRLASIQPSYGNVDGHTLEFYRKRALESPALQRHICYYTDGAMPAMNYEEELEVLQENIRICEQQKINLLAVGIETDSPEEHGFKTVKVDSDDDLIKVVQQLQRAVT